MPYNVQQMNGRYCVIKVPTGERMGCHASQQEAEQQRRAILANEAKVRSGFKTLVGADGRARWLAWSSSAYRDRDVNPFTGGGEIVSLAALKLWAAYANKTGNFGSLWWAHDAAKKIGPCDGSFVAGAFLIETGTFDDTPLGRKAAAWLQSYDGGSYGPLGVSIGFDYQLADRLDAVYDVVLIKERSVLPLAVAANQYTQFESIV